MGVGLDTRRDTWCFPPDVTAANLTLVNPSYVTQVLGIQPVADDSQNRLGIPFTVYKAGLLKILVSNLQPGEYCFSINVKEPTDEELVIKTITASGSVITGALKLNAERVYYRFTTRSGSPVTYIQLQLTKDTTLGGAKVEQGAYATPNRSDSTAALSSLKAIQAKNFEYATAQFGLIGSTIRGVLPTFMVLEHMGYKTNYASADEVLTITNPHYLRTVKYGMMDTLDSLTYGVTGGVRGGRYRALYEDAKLQLIQDSASILNGIRFGV
jgi:hypothetical protein